MLGVDFEVEDRDWWATAGGDSGDLGGTKDNVVYNGTTPVAGADIILLPLP